ncbi:MAG: hypothetical protein SFX73_01055 [Kofleriaceae bacterium]|nr:hypothetical protein [Kofleriaceae bacterium]
MRLALLLAVVAACGDNLTPPLEAGAARSGARLKVERYVYPDGTTQFETSRFYDAQRGEECTPEVWSDGQTYCTPAFSEAVYSDADCLGLIGRVEEADRVPDYFLRTYTLDGVEHPSKLFEAGAAVQPPQAIWRLRNGACFGPETPGPDDRFYNLGTEVRRELLVRIKHATSKEPSRIAVTSVITDDGLQVPTELSDRELERPCDLDLAATGGVIQCIPRGAREASYYADEACSVAQLDVSLGEPVPPVVWTRDTATGCTAYHEVGDLVIGPVFRRIVGACQPVNAPSDAQFYRLERPFEVATLARTRDHRDGRRLLGIHASEGELTIDDPRLFDTELATECRRTEIAPGDFRCVPVTATPVTALFANPECTDELLIALIDTSTCALRAPYAMRTDVDAITFHALGEPRTAPAYFISTGERCLPFTPTEPDIAMYNVGPALTEAKLAPATVVTDP